MIKLTLDTSIAKQASVKISKGETLLVQTEGEEALLTIEQALQKAKLKLEQIDSFAAKSGPGSYTGLRIGAAIINTLNWAFNKNALPIEPIYG